MQNKTTLRNNVLENNLFIPHFSLIQWLHQHWQAFLSSFNKMSQAPLATCMTLAVIGIALALPCGLFVVLQNVQQLSHEWNNGTQISLYLKKSVTEARGRQLSQELSLRESINTVDYISPQQGLDKFKHYSGFDDVLNELPDNPLPGVILIHPGDTLSKPQNIQVFLQQLKNLAEVDIAKLDMAWVNRLYHMLELGRAVIYALTLLLCFSVILIIGNTIRLATQSYHTEIKVIKLVGGTNTFIRRPFLYSGILYGALGGIFAMILVSLFTWWLDSPVQQLAVSYNSHFTLTGLDNESSLLLIACGAMLGLLGSWLAVTQHLHDIEP